MSVELYALNADADPKHCDLSPNAAVIIFELCGAPFHEEVGETSAATALHYARIIRATLMDGEFERVCAAEGKGETMDDYRAVVTEYAEFCERSGGYTMWA
jgi:hypothetical protein